MAQEFLIRNTEELTQIVSYIHDHFESSNKPIKTKLTQYGRRSLSQNAFQHVIYEKISKFLISRGREEWTPAFVKENLKNKFLGWHEKQYIDVETGQKLVRSVLRKTSNLDRGEAFHFTTAILEWSESIGCRIEIPAECEYRELMNAQCQ
ncbi:hypothetical protein [Vibrio sp. SCSIO 43136]|uniref:hypothetical protein n=1 Tax=Vibrio sp. SCSIO 43136 TaxID=2819101 RepID=UPI0020765C21|nr:hypothetical protein [Vibrio sp. SCSIO 43136]USD64228.1 hypothetical protein J4N39_08905 [Vibrio sp. SCSIO 43136]